MLTVLLGLLCVMYAVWTWRLRTSKSPHDPPFFRGVLPIIGHTYLLIGNSKKFYNFLISLSRECEQNGGILRAYIGREVYYGITDGEDILTVANACVKKNYIFDFIKPCLENGLLTSSGPIWHRHRKLLNPAFNTRVLYGYLDAFNGEARSLVRELLPEADKKPFDITKYLKISTIRASFLTNLGYDTKNDTQRITTYLKTIDELMDLSTKRIQYVWLQYDYIFKLTGWERKQNEIIKILHNTSKFIIKKKKEELQNSKGQRTTLKPLIELLLQLHEDGTFTEQELRAEVDTAAIASTVSSVILLLVLVHIGTYPHVQERLYDEIKSVFGDTERNVEKDDISKLVYTEAIISETIRLFPSTPVQLRYVDKDIPLKKYTLPAGSNCAFMVPGLNQGHAWGADADQFRPERWLHPEELPPSNIHHIGFGMGKRSCIGKTFAMIFMKTVLVHLMRFYRVTGDANKVELKLDLVISSESGHYVSLERRS